MKTLEVAGAVKRYGRTLALDGVSFSLEEGFATGLVGPNGAGKTTLLKAVLGLVRLDSGEVRVFGIDPRRDPEGVRSRVGFVHETNVLPENLTAAELGLVGASAYASWDARTYGEYLERFAIDPKSRVKALSKGNRTRLSAALAFSHRAELLVLDEPASGMDPLVRRDLVRIATEELAREGRTILVSTHITTDLDRFADWVAFLGTGRIRLLLSRTDIESNYAVCKGPADAFDEAPGLFRGVERGPYGARAFTGQRAEASRRFGSRLSFEAPSIEDLMVMQFGEVSA